MQTQMNKHFFFMKMDFFGLRDKMQPEKENKGGKRKTRKRKTRSTQIMYTFFKQCEFLSTNKFIS